MASIDFGGLGGAVSGLFGAFGDFAEGRAYKTASQLAAQNAQIAMESMRIQETQASRQIYKTLGSQAAAVGGANLASSGSALDILRSSAQQGSLTKQLIQQQGLITAHGFEAESAQYQAMSQAAKGSGVGGIFGSILKGVGAVLPFLSDGRLKENIVKVAERSDGIGIYSYNWRGSDTTYFGVVAQDVMKFRPDAVSLDKDGWLCVDYDAIDHWPLVERSV